MDRHVALALALCVTAWLVYRPGIVSQGYNLADPLLTVPTTLSLLNERDLDLSEYAAEVDPGFYGLLRVEGRTYNRYPIGGSLLVAPLVWLAGPPEAGESPMGHALRVAGATAKVVAAVSVALLFLVLARIARHPAVALGLTLLFAVATPHYPIHAGGLWTHNLSLPLLLVAILLLVARDGRLAWLAALPLAFAFLTRPTTLLASAMLTAYVAWRWPRALPRYLALVLVVLVPFVVWSHFMYGSLLPPYFLGFHSQAEVRMPVRGPSPQALVGNLVSPNRGLFVYVPVLAFSLWGMARAFRAYGTHAPLFRTLSIAVIVHWVAVSSIARSWWAGWSFGPRNFMEVLPLWILLLVPAVEAFAGLRPRARLAVGVVGGAAVAWGLFAAVYGANAWGPHEWNASPVPIGERPERIWDWGDMQILRGTGLQ